MFLVICFQVQIYQYISSKAAFAWNKFACRAVSAALMRLRRHVADFCLAGFLPLAGIFPAGSFYPFGVHTALSCYRRHFPSRYGRPSFRFRKVMYRTPKAHVLHAESYPLRL